MAVINEKFTPVEQPEAVEVSVKQPETVEVPETETKKKKKKK